MNLFLLGIIIFVVIYLFLNWFARASSKKIATNIKKIAPEASGLIDQFTSEEDVVSLPISAIKAYAMKIYGGDERLAVQNFITDLSGEQPDNTNVPPDTATESQGMMTQQSDDVPSDIQAIDEGEQLA